MRSDDTTVRIPLRATDGSVRAYALVDAADADWVNQWRWHLDGDYAARMDKSSGVKRPVRMHRALLGLTPSDHVVVDHVDRNTLNNRRQNLRAIPGWGNQQNIRNRTGSRSAHRGVTFHSQTGKWRARVWMGGVGGKAKSLGLFETEELAAEAARLGRQELMPYSTD